MAYSPHTLFLLFLLIFFSDSYQECPNRVSYTCHDFHGTSLRFPFTTSSLPDCGYCVLDCKNRNATSIQCGKQQLAYQIKEIFPENNTLIVVYPGLQELTSHACKLHQSDSVIIPTPSLTNFKILQLMVFIRCLKHPGHGFTLKGPSTTCENDIIYGPYAVGKISDGEHPPDCSTIYLPNSTNDYFPIQYQLTDECLQCASDRSQCFDPSGNKFQCPRKGKMALMHGVALASSFVGALVLLFIIMFLMRRKLIENFRSDKNIETLLENYGSLAPKRYTYADIKKMTNSFKEKLGEGGYGGVYKGKLLDGRLVAVKLLKQTEGNGEEFLNEVASISRTNHVNVVTLLGFSCAGQKRALIYEFMANGSLEKFINCGTNRGQSLPWEKLFHITLGIARGLEYLHRGCMTRILHFDIKPHNILLDDEFCPKISDFGLAKVSQQNKQSKVSMSRARGTIGYIAPEMFCRNFGDVSHKSDVYSYGMMVLEVIGSRKNENAEVGCSSELYFPQWIYKQLEREEDTETDSTVKDLNDEEIILKRKMTIVSLWCIQTIPSTRPSMSTVVQMLEGSLESIQIPPMPSISSPPRSQFDPSGSSIMTL